MLWNQFCRCWNTLVIVCLKPWSIHSCLSSLKWNPNLLGPDLCVVFGPSKTECLLPIPFEVAPGLWMPCRSLSTSSSPARREHLFRTLQKPQRNTRRCTSLHCSPQSRVLIMLCVCNVIQYNVVDNYMYTCCAINYSSTAYDAVSRHVTCSIVRSATPYYAIYDIMWYDSITKHTR